ncbi:protein phosphatase 2C domain-containing protein [Halonotius sp. GCM10025705]|uniref:protein phosphatase 2C domain-containing protein n=1 Tax=Halonotius sp. GCM10025705 TaxID=3252678 RepID=UPI003614F84A
MQGPGHEEEDLPCQDSWNKTQLDDGSFAIAVGDGLGSASHSDIGSEVATERATEYLENFLSTTDSISEKEGKEEAEKCIHRRKRSRKEGS